MSRKVALVDDSNAFCLLVETLLGEHQIEVTSFSDAESFLSKSVRQEAFDLYLFDISLPGKSGLEMLAELKAQPQTSAIPVILLTGDTTKGTVHQAASLGISGYLGKPITPELFVERVLYCLESQGEHGQR